MSSQYGDHFCEIVLKSDFEQITNLCEQQKGTNKAIMNRERNKR